MKRLGDVGRRFEDGPRVDGDEADVRGLVPAQEPGIVARVLLEDGGGSGGRGRSRLRGALQGKETDERRARRSVAGSHVFPPNVPNLRSGTDSRAGGVVNSFCPGLHVPVLRRGTYSRRSLYAGEEWGLRGRRGIKRGRKYPPFAGFYIGPTQRERDAYWRVWTRPRRQRISAQPLCRCADQSRPWDRIAARPMPNCLEALAIGDADRSSTESHRRRCAACHYLDHVRFLSFPLHPPTHRNRPLCRALCGPSSRAASDPMPSSNSAANSSPSALIPAEIFAPAAFSPPAAVRRPGSGREQKRYGSETRKKGTLISLIHANPGCLSVQVRGSAPKPGRGNQAGRKQGCAFLPGIHLMAAGMSLDGVERC